MVSCSPADTLRGFMARVRQYRCSIVPWRARLASDGPTAARTTAIARAPVPPHRLRPAPGWFPRRSNALGRGHRRREHPRRARRPSRADPAVAAGELVDQRDAPSPARCGCIAAPTPTAPRRRGRQAHRPPRGRSPDPVRPRTRPARRFERLMDQIRGRLGEGSVQLGRGMPAAHDAPHPMTYSPQGRV